MNIEKEVAVIAAAILYESKELEWTSACQSVALLYNHLTSTDHMDYNMASNILQVSEQVKRPFIINGRLYRGVLNGVMVTLKKADDFNSDQKSVFVVPDFLLQKASNLNGNKPKEQGNSKIQPNKMREIEKLRLSPRETLRISIEKAQKSSQESRNLKQADESHAPVAGTEKSSGGGGMVLKIGNTVKIVGGDNEKNSRDQNISETVKKKGPTANPVKSVAHHNGLQGGEELRPILPCLIFVLVHGFGVIFEELVIAHLRLYHALYGGNFKLKSIISDFVRNRCIMEYNQKSYTLSIEKGKVSFDRSEEMAEHKISKDNYKNFYDRLKPIVCADSAEDKFNYNPMHSEAQVEIEFDELEFESGPPITLKYFADALQTSSLYLQEFYTEKIAPNLINDDRSSFLARIHNILSSSNPPPFELHLFGSSINLLGSTTADADLTIIASGSTDHPYSIINKLRKVLHRNGMRDIVGIKFARVPICKFKEPWSNISCDINFGHALGVYNSKLLRAYVSLDSRVRPFLLLIKTFAKARGINDPSATISSYAYCLMGIAYLQHLKILPNLQRPESINLRQIVTVPAEREPFGQQRIVDVSFVPVERTLKEVLSKFIADSDFVWGDSGVIKLLDGFLYYFAHEYPYDGNLAVSIRDGGFAALADSESSRLVVLDPFEIGRNCTSSVQQSLNIVVMEFKCASSALREGRAEALFEPKATKIGGNRRRRKINHIN